MNRAQAELLREYIRAEFAIALTPKDVMWNRNEKDYTLIGGDKYKQAIDYAEMAWSHFYRQLPKDEPISTEEHFPYCDKTEL